MKALVKDQIEEKLGAKKNHIRVWAVIEYHYPGNSVTLTTLIECEGEEEEVKEKLPKWAESRAKLQFANIGIDMNDIMETDETMTITVDHAEYI